MDTTVPLPIQLPVNVPGRGVEDGRGPWTAASTWQTERKLLGEWTSEQKISYLSSLYKSAFQIKKLNFFSGKLRFLKNVFENESSNFHILCKALQYVSISFLTHF